VKLNFIFKSKDNKKTAQFEMIEGFFVLGGSILARALGNWRGENRSAASRSDSPLMRKLVVRKFRITGFFWGLG